MKEKIKDIVIRAIKTFIQGFLATLIVLVKESDLSDTNILKSILIGAIAGGISAVMNFVIKSLEPYKEIENHEMVDEEENDEH